MAAPNSRDTLSEYALRRLGEPVIEVNVDPDQKEDRMDDALQWYQDYHSDAVHKTYLKHQLTSTDVTNKYISVSSNILFVTKLFPIAASQVGRGMMSVKYQLHLNDLYNMNTFMGELGYYTQTQQYISLLDDMLAGSPLIDFNRKQGRLYIFGDFEDQDLKAGDFVIAEAFQAVDPNAHNKIFDDKWLKEYTTALFKQQWGANLIKFEGMQLPGGVTLNGSQIFQDGTADVERLREELRLTHEAPVDFFIG